MQISQFDEIFNLILQVSTLVSMVSDVIVEMAEFGGISLGPIPSQRLRSAVVDLLLGGDKDSFPSVH